MHERNLVALLLVRAVEERDAAFFAPELLSESALAAVGARDDAELLEKRTAYLFLRLPRHVRAWARAALLPENALGLVALAAFALGAISNYLGPTRLVHVVKNPLVLLVVWNLGVYAALIWRRVRGHRPRREPAPPAPGEAPAGAPEPAALPAAEGLRGRGGLLRLLIPDLWLGWNRWRARLRSGGSEIASQRKIAGAFWDSYWAAAGGVVVARVEALLHVGAIGLVLGAIAGIYVRGLFFEYNAVWSSTFVREAGAVAALLDLLLAPACLILDGALLTRDAVVPLLSPEGTLAAPWIHRLALTGILLAVLPRGILAALAARRARDAAAAIEVDLSEPYYAEAARAAREGQIHRIREGVATVIRLEIGKFAESVALLVRNRFFDKCVAPTLLGFRNRGGRLADVEAELDRQRAGFEAELEEHLHAGQREFQQGVREGVRAIVGRELPAQLSPAGEIGPGSLPVDAGLSGAVATQLGDAVGAGVTAAVAATAATLSGGVGKALGVAVLAHLLGVSGPVGLLIGGVAAVATVGGAFVLGRERVAAATRSWNIPAPIAALALRDSRLEQAREATYAEVKGELESLLGAQAADTAEEVLRQLSLAVVARERGAGLAGAGR